VGAVVRQSTPTHSCHEPSALEANGSDMAHMIPRLEDMTPVTFRERI
jgi:hypothetical protein